LLGVQAIIKNEKLKIKNKYADISFSLPVFIEINF
jgi:hypothetical protein